MRKKWMKVKKRKSMRMKAYAAMIKAAEPHIAKAFAERSPLWDLVLTPQSLAKEQGWTRYEDADWSKNYSYGRSVE